MCFRALLFTLVGLFCLLFHHSPVSGNDDAVCTGGGGRCYCCLVHVASVLSIPAISTCNTAGGFLRLGPWGQAGSAEVHTQGGGPHHWGWLSCFPYLWDEACSVLVPGSPQWDRLHLSIVVCWTYPILAFSPSLSHFSAITSVFPGTTSPVSHLSSNPSVRICFWGHHEEPWGHTCNRGIQPRVVSDEAWLLWASNFSKLRPEGWVGISQPKEAWENYRGRVF